MLIARELERRALSVAHIGGDGSLETQRDAMLRLIDLLGMARADLLASQEELIDAALSRQALRIAYVDASLI